MQNSNQASVRSLNFVWNIAGFRCQAGVNLRSYPPSLILRGGEGGHDTKQLLDEVEHDIMNYQNRGLCYLPKPKAEADNTDTRF